jgi:3-deoxy-7-phosphoheptulonate synthase
LQLHELPAYLEDIQLCHDTWKKRRAIYQRMRQAEQE